MEDSRILNWRGWSPIRKTQVVVTALGFLLTAGLILQDVFPIELPHGALSRNLFDVALLLERPSEAIAHFLGIRENFGSWWWRGLEVSVNTVLAFATGTALGLLMTFVKRTRNRRNL